jgi:ATP-dependent DNA ligase
VRRLRPADRGALCFKLRRVALPLKPPVAPQLARSAKAIPTGGGYAYEPKWDGFRALAFVDGADVYLQSRNGRPLRRYFPELSFPEGRYVLDGEIVLFDDEGRQDFDMLGQRIHPAGSRIRMLAELVAKPVDLTPSTTDPAEAEPWLRGAEGVIAKLQDAPYKPGERTGMTKIKRVRTIDAVVLGWRPGKLEDTVGSLILALYDESGKLRPVGHTSGFSAKEKRELPARLAEHETGRRGTGDPSRWANERDLEWIELRPELVVEVTFDHTSNGRIRHGAKVARWRTDKDPRDCTLEQLAQ